MTKITDKTAWIIPAPVKSESLAENLGISKERLAELVGKMSKAIMGSNDYVTALVQLQKEVKNFNEMTFITFHFGALSEQMKAIGNIKEKLMITLFSHDVVS